MTIHDYVVAHTARGECRCGKCVDRGNRPDPEGHTADLFFFPVAAVAAPDADRFRTLTREHPGDYVSFDPFDGKEHSFIELGGWIGDQGLALQYMGLGVLLGVFALLTPKTMMPFLDEETQRTMAGAGMVSIQAVSVVREDGDGTSIDAAWAPALDPRE
jgi:hypothetical protein